ncbi:MAG: hypothetical protein K0R46_1804 [Herbinix sp.]|jgi:hypothetical protein|nr:hypothetical protein [Herbinix sp.]
MAVGPIEVIRAQEATQIRHMDVQRAQHAQEQISRNFQNMVQHEHDKPTQTTKSENNEYRYDAKEKGNNQFAGSGNKKRDKDEKKPTKDGKITPKSGGFDVLI